LVAIPPRRLADGISAEVPDWSRERKRRFEWDPSRALIAALRDYDRLKPGFFTRPRKCLVVLRHRFWSIVTGAEIPLGTKIAGGLLMPHPNGIVMHPQAIVGPNCMILHQVTLGMRGGKAPVIGGHVDLGAGAKIIGGVTHALVIRDVPPGGVVKAPLGELYMEMEQDEG
jgi:serine O-acetyltransferase